MLTGGFQGPGPDRAVPAETGLGAWGSVGCPDQPHGPATPQHAEARPGQAARPFPSDRVRQRGPQTSASAGAESLSTGPAWQALREAYGLSRWAGRGALSWNHTGKSGTGEGPGGRQGEPGTGSLSRPRAGRCGCLEAGTRRHGAQRLHCQRPPGEGLAVLGTPSPVSGA